MHQFFENGNVATRAISCLESRTDAVRFGTFAYVAPEIRPRIL